MNRKEKITKQSEPLDVCHLNLKIYPYYGVPAEDGVDRFPFASYRLLYDGERKDNDSWRY